MLVLSDYVACRYSIVLRRRWRGVEATVLEVSQHLIRLAKGWIIAFPSGFAKDLRGLSCSFVVWFHV